MLARDREGAAAAGPSEQPLKRVAFCVTGAVVSALILLSTLARGLFFPREQLLFDLVVFATFVCYCTVIYWRRAALWPGELGLLIAIGGLVAAYTVAGVAAVHAYAAIVAALGAGAAWCIHIMAQHLAIIGAGGRRLLNGIVLSATVIAVFGLGVFIGSWSWEGALWEGRLAATFQYPNTLAAFLTAGVACAVACSLTALRAGAVWLYRAAAGAMAVAFALAVSRATALGLPIVIAIHVTLSHRDLRLRTGLEWLGAGIPALLAVRAVLVAVAAGNAVKAWLCVGAAVVAACLLGWFFEWMTSREWPAWPAGRLRSLAVAGVVTLVIAGVGWLVAESAPTLAAIRIAGTPLATAGMATGREIGPQNLWFRLTVMADAVRATLDRPWFGAGGGAWWSLFSAYQRTGYISRQVHSFPIQLVLETGVLGLMALLLTGFFALRSIRLTLRAFPQSSERGAVAGAVAALAAIVGHSLVDFDLSYLSMLLLVSALLGCLGGAVAIAEFPSRTAGDAGRSGPVAPVPLVVDWRRSLLFGRTSSGVGDSTAAVPVVSEIAIPPAGVGGRRLIGARLAAPAAGVIALLLFLFTARLALAEFHAWRGEQRVAAGDYAGAVVQFEQAVWLNPRASPHHRALAEALLNRFLREGDPELAAAAVRAAQAAVAYNRYHADTQAVLARAYLEAGDAEAAAAAATEAVRLERFQTRHYALLGEARVAAAVVALAKGDTARASMHLAATLEIPERIRAVQAEQRRYGWGQAPSVTPAVSLSLGQAEALRGDWTKAEALLRGAKFEGEMVRQADPWLAWVYERLGRGREAEALRRRAWVQVAWRDPRFLAALRLAPVPLAR